MAAADAGAAGDESVMARAQALSALPLLWLHSFQRKQQRWRPRSMQRGTIPSRLAACSSRSCSAGLIDAIPLLLLQCPMYSTAQ